MNLTQIFQQVVKTKREAHSGPIDEPGALKGALNTPKAREKFKK
jgi:hypothetical protein